MRGTAVGPDGPHGRLTRSKELLALTGQQDGIVRLVLVVAICHSHEVVRLVIDEAVVALRESIESDSETVADALVLSVDHQGRNRQAHVGILVVVDDHVDVVLDVHLGDEAGGLHVVELVWTDFVVAELVDLVALEDVAAVRTVERLTS